MPIAYSTTATAGDRTVASCCHGRAAEKAGLSTASFLVDLLHRETEATHKAVEAAIKEEKMLIERNKAQTLRQDLCVPSRERLPPNGVSQLNLTKPPPTVSLTGCSKHQPLNFLFPAEHEQNARIPQGNRESGTCLQWDDPSCALVSRV